MPICSEEKSPYTITCTKLLVLTNLTNTDDLDLMVSVMISLSCAFAVSALLYPDCQRDQGPLMFIGTEMIPLQCVVIRSEIF